MPGIQSRVGTFLDVAATVALTVSIVLLLVLFADLLSPLPDTVGSDPNYLSALASAAMFIGLLSTPTICCAIAWPVHIRQKRRGERVFGWLRFVVMASAVWMWFVFVGLTNL